MLRLQAVDGHSYEQPLQAWPRRTQFAEGAGYNLHVYCARQQRRNHQLQFTVAHQRVTANDRKVQRLEAINNFKDSIDQRLPTAIAQVPQCLSATQMRGVVGVTPRTFQGAFLGDFYGKGGWFPLEDFAPCLKNLRGVHPRPSFLPHTKCAVCELDASLAGEATGHRFRFKPISVTTISIRARKLPLGKKRGGNVFLPLSLAKMLSRANAFRISDHQLNPR